MSSEKNKSLKPGWHRVKFGNVVRPSKARSQDPLADGFERYVGLEHLEPGDLRIRSWGNVADGVTFTSMFHSGQVLFGKRRAYQRKVAVADFAGVCSGDIYVLETKDAQVLLPELLPLICQTDAFFDHAVGTSAGSLSPRTNWTSLADFEFLLPPIKEQERTIKLLSAVEELLNGLGCAFNALHKVQQSFFDEYLALSDRGNGTLINRPKMVKVGSVTDSVVPGRNKPKEFGGDIPWLVTADLVSPVLRQVPNALKVSEKELKRVGGKIVPAGAVIITCVGNLGIVSLLKMSCSLNQQLHAFIPKPDLIDSNYLAAALRAQKRQMERLANITTVPYLNKDNCESICIPLPNSLDVQKQLAEKVQQFDDGLASLKTRLSSLKSMKCKILNETMT